MSNTVLHIDASARADGSITRELSAEVVQALAPQHVIRRDLASEALPQLTGDWVGANFTPADARSEEQLEKLAQSDALVQELKSADTIVIGAPLYNFGIPSSLKAWVDLIARVGVTFNYTETGPKGLLTGKRAIVVVATGGTPVGSDWDFASGYLRHVLSFIGITDVEFITADERGADAQSALAAKQDQIAALAA